MKFAQIVFACAIYWSVLVLFAACNTKKQSSDAVTNIFSAQNQTKQQKQTLTEQKKVIASLTPNNVPESKGSLNATNQTALQQNAAIGESLGLAEKGAKEDAKTIQNSSDPAKESLRRWGGIILIAGVLCAAAGFGLGTTLPGISPYLRSGGVTAIVGGLFIICVAHFLGPIYLIVGTLVVGALALGGLWVWMHWNEILPAIKTKIQLTRIPFIDGSPKSTPDSPMTLPLK